MQVFFNDVRFALRQLRKSPGFTLTILLTLALGIGANISIFTVVDAALLKPLPYPEAQQLVEIGDVDRTKPDGNGLLGVARFRDLQEQNHGFSGMAFFYFDNATLSQEGQLPERAKGEDVSGEFFRVVGGQPLLGRALSVEDDKPNAPEVAVISYGLWQRSFGGERSVVGRKVVLNGKAATLVGVMPASFNYPYNADLWRPSHLDLSTFTYRGVGSHFVIGVARLKPGVSMQAARNELKVISQRLAQQFGGTDSNWDFTSIGLRERLVGDLRPALLVLMTAVLFVLLIACANIANLMLSRAAARQREMALRQALGAARGRLVRQVMTESVLLALLGGGIGVAVVAPLIHLIATRLPQGLVDPTTLHVNAQVLLFATVVSVLTGILFGLAPTVALLRGSVQNTLKQGESRATGRDRHHLRSALVMTQVGLSLLLLVGAGLMIKTFWKLQEAPLGFSTDHVLSFEVSLPWGSKPEAVKQFYDQVREKIAALPGVDAVGTITSIPLGGSYSNLQSYWLEGQPHAGAGDIVAELRAVNGDYFKALSIPLLAGRLLTLQDQQAGAPLVAIIDQVMAEKYFPHENPIGKRLMLKDFGGFEIVGVIGAIRGATGDIKKAPVPGIYTADNGSWPNDDFVVRAHIAPAMLARAVREQVQAVNPTQAVHSIATLDSLAADAVAQPRVNTYLLGSFAALALLLAAIGLYGVIAYGVAERTREIGVRMALGAQREEVVALFLKQGLRWSLMGASGGMIAALALTRLMRSLLFEVAPYDPWIFTMVAGLLLVVAIASSWLPARRAASVDPMQALRNE